MAELKAQMQFIMRLKFGHVVLLQSDNGWISLLGFTQNSFVSDRLYLALAMA